MESKKKRSESLSKRNPRKTLEQAAGSWQSPRFLSVLRSKLATGRDLKFMFTNRRRERATEVTPQARLVKCPKCRKILQEPEDVPAYRCGGCDTVLQAKRWKSEGKVASSLNETDAAQINDNSVPEAILLSSGECDSRAEDESADSSTATSGSSKSPRNKSYYHVYDAGTSSSGERDDNSKAAFAHERSIVSNEWLRRDKFPVTIDSDLQVLARDSPHNNVQGNAATREWIQLGRYQNLPRVPFYPMSPSPSSAYECASPFHASCVSTSEHIYYHHWNYFGQYGREGWSGESSGASPRHFSGETFDGRYYHWSRQSPLRDFQYQGFSGYNFCESRSSCTSTPQRSTYSEHYYPIWSPKIESSSQKDVNTYVMERIRAVKRHVLPSAGGAPFVTCYYCLELLQLPQVFLRGKQKSNLVRCGSCFGVLKFSLQEKTRSVPYTPGVLDATLSHSTGKVSSHDDDQDSALMDDEERHPDGGDMSCSDNDRGDCVCKRNSSTDGELVSLEKFEGIREDRDAKNILNVSSETMLESEMLVKNPGLGETTGEISGFHLEHSQNETHVAHSENSRNEYENPGATLDPGLGEASGETSGFHLEHSQSEHVARSENSRNEYENPGATLELDKSSGEGFRCNLKESRDERNETLEPGKMARDGPGVSLEDSGDENEKTSKTQGQGEATEERRSVSHLEEPLNDKEISTETLELRDNMEERHQSGSFFAPSFGVGEFDPEESREEEGGYKMEERHQSGSFFAPSFGVGEFDPEESREEEGGYKINLEERHQSGWFFAPSFGAGEFVSEESREEEGEYAGEILELDETMGERPGLHLEEYESNYDDLSRASKCSEDAHKFSTFHTEEPETKSNDSRKTLEPHKAAEGRSELSRRSSLNDHDSSTEAPEMDETRGERGTFHLEESLMAGENEAATLEQDETLEPLEQDEAKLEELLFHLELSENKQENLRQTLETSEAKEETQTYRSELSPDGHENSRRTLELDGEAAKEAEKDHSEQSHDEKKKPDLSFEPYAHLYGEVDPTEIVGLRQALYPMQSSPLRSPLTSPLHTPVGSPLRYPLGSPLRSPIVSPLRSPIVSPLRSPISSPFSLSDALFFSK